MTAATRPRFAPHLGFPAPDRPLFRALLGSADPLDHLAFLGEAGFDAVADPFVAQRSIEAQARIGREAARRGLAFGSFLYAPLAQVRAIAWGSADREVDTVLDRLVADAVETGRRIGARSIAVLSARDPASPLPAQQARMAGRLRRLADRLAPHGFALCLEAVDPSRLPGMLMTGIDDAHALVRRADHDGVRLIFDTGHVASEGGDVVAAYGRVRDAVSVIQYADFPGRVEIGAGSIDFDALGEAIGADGPDTAIELEHGWLIEDAGRQQAYLERIRSFDREGSLHEP